MNKNEYLSERNPKELIWFMITHPLRLMLSKTKYSILCVGIDKVVGKFCIPLFVTMYVFAICFWVIVGFYLVLCHTIEYLRLQLAYFSISDFP